MKKIYFIKFSWDGGKSFRVYRKWFFQNIIVQINKELKYMESNGMKNVFIDSIEVVR